jgi:dihydrofolate synthase / folylpolyglutamate synthase
MQMATYEQAVERLYALGHELHLTPADKFDLKHMRTLSRALGDPWKKFACVLVAGTNGKGSTSATLASILQASGYKTGLYTSPHLIRINERIRVNGEPIGDERFASTYGSVRDLADELVAQQQLPQSPSFFETLTAMAFEHFANVGVEIAVLEVGMGGRLDATNVVEPILSVITDIDLDHQKYLGETIGEIAREKAGIMRKGVPVVMLPQHPLANDVLGKYSIEIGAVAINASHNMAAVSPRAADLVEQTSTKMRFQLNVLGEGIEVESPLVGRHQIRNLALAITAAEVLAKKGFHISAKDIAAGTRETKWPGRFQLLEATAQHPTVVFDVAHNAAGAWALRSVLNERLGDRPKIFVFGVMRDKAVGEIAQILFPTAEHVVVTTTDNNPRATPTAELAQIAREQSAEVTEAPNVKVALEKAYALANSKPANHDGAPVVVICGSIYIVGDAMKLIVG